MSEMWHEAKAVSKSPANHPYLEKLFGIDSITKVMVQISDIFMNFTDNNNQDY